MLVDVKLFFASVWSSLFTGRAGCSRRRVQWGVFFLNTGGLVLSERRLACLDMID